MPVAGIIIFLLLYFSSALYYPGGSQVNINSKGFDWAQNYWCDLLDTTAINGGHNTSRPIALTAMVVLCLSLAVFWVIFPVVSGTKKTWRLIIQITGILSMTTCAFLLTGFHDMVINIASVFGIIAVAGTITVLKQLGWTVLFWLGILNVLLVVLNNILYYGEGLLLYLPIVQKITFLSFLLWICGINYRLTLVNR